MVRLNLRHPIQEEEKDNIEIGSGKWDGPLGKENGLVEGEEEKKDFLEEDMSEHQVNIWDD